MVAFYTIFSQNTARIDSVIRVDLFPARLYFFFPLLLWVRNRQQWNQHQLIQYLLTGHRGEGTGLEAGMSISMWKATWQGGLERPGISCQRCNSRELTRFASTRVGVRRTNWVSTCEVLSTALDKRYFLSVIFHLLPTSVSLPSPMDSIWIRLHLLIIPTSTPFSIPAAVLGQAGPCTVETLIQASSHSLFCVFYLYQNKIHLLELHFRPQSSLCKALWGPNYSPIKF